MTFDKRAYYREYRKIERAKHPERVREQIRKKQMLRKLAKDSMRALLLEVQDGCCAICGMDLREGKSHLDHDHQTLYLRGLLCPECNVNLDRPSRASAELVQYLEHPPMEKIGQIRWDYAGTIKVGRVIRRSLRL